MLKGAGLENEDLTPYLQLIEARLSKSKFLQGDELGIMDLSLYGMTNVLHTKPTLEAFQSMLD